jgi:hypothetical protein
MTLLAKVETFFDRSVSALMISLGAAVAASVALIGA